MSTNSIRYPMKLYIYRIWKKEQAVWVTERRDKLTDTSVSNTATCIATSDASGNTGMTGLTGITGMTRMTRMTQMTRLTRMTRVTRATRVTRVTRMNPNQVTSAPMVSCFDQKMGQIGP